MTEPDPRAQMPLSAEDIEQGERYAGRQENEGGAGRRHPYEVLAGHHEVVQHEMPAGDDDGLSQPGTGGKEHDRHQHVTADPQPFARRHAAATAARAMRPAWRQRAGRSARNTGFK